MFTQLDLFGKPVALNFNGKDKSKSSAGSWFSLLFFGFIGWSIYQMGQDLINRKDPKTIMSEYFEENPSPMIISPDTFNFAFGLQHPITSAHYINESIYTVQVTRDQMTRIRKEDGTIEMKWVKTPLVMERCTTAHFGPLGPKFENIELDSLYCIKRDQPAIKEITVQGAFESPVFEDISIFIRECNNQTSSVTCAPRETLNALLGGGWFATYFTNLAIEPRNYENPNLGYRDSFYTAMSNEYYKEITMWLSHVEVASDSGWLTKEVKNQKFIKFDRQQEYMNFRPTPGEMMTFIVRVGKITTHYERSYIKVHDVIAQTNGLISTGIVIGLIILMPYSNIKFYERLINELFDVKFIKKNRSNSRKLSKKPSSPIIVDGDKIDNSTNQEGTLGIKINGDTKQPSNSDSFPAFLPCTQRYNQSNPKHVDRSRSMVNLSPQPSVAKYHSRTKKFIISRYQSFSNANQDIKLLKVDISSIQTKEVISSQIKEKTSPDTNIEITSSKLLSPATHLLQDKPKQSGQLQLKVLENSEIQSPRDSVFAIESLIFDTNGKEKQSSKQVSETHCDDNKLNRIENANVVEIKIHDDYSPKILKTSKGINGEDIVERAELLPLQLVKDSEELNITFWEYVKYYLWRSQSVKEKFELLNQGIERIQERLNIFNVLKKLREVDKLKLLLLENEQLILFDTLPNPELSHLNAKERFRRKSFSHIQLKETKFIADKRKNELVKQSYITLKKKRKSTMIDGKLLEIYDDIINS